MNLSCGLWPRWTETFTCLLLWIYHFTHLFFDVTPPHMWTSSTPEIQHDDRLNACPTFGQYVRTLQQSGCVCRGLLATRQRCLLQKSIRGCDQDVYSFVNDQGGSLFNISWIESSFVIFLLVMWRFYSLVVFLVNFA